jgi:hypothetical protein
MLLTPAEAELFFKLHRALMFFVNQQLHVLPHEIKTVDDYAVQSPEARLKVHKAFVDEIDLIEKFIDENPAGLTEEELEIVHSWYHLVTLQFFIFRYLTKYTVFLSTGKEPIAYGVLALSESIEDLIGPYLPVMTETTLLPFQDKIVYDSILNSYSISFGGGIRRNLKEDYEAAKKRLGIVTSLPIIEAQPVPKTKSIKKPKRRRAKPVSDDVHEILEVILGMIDQFCRDHLNEEYATLCRKLAEKLVRKRPSPLLSGKPVTWACGIIRTIGLVNFLDDRSQTPHMKLTEIDKAFGVGSSTGQGKSKAIRSMLKIRQFDHRWTLTSRMDENPMIWMLEVNGFIMDIRNCPREMQETAFQKGLIPYIPEDRTNGPG